jgi:hypothetical protein
MAAGFAPRGDPITSTDHIEWLSAFGRSWQFFDMLGVFFDMLAFLWTWYPPPFLKLNGLHTRSGPAFGIGRAL